MADVLVTDRDGVQRTLDAPDGTPLMDTLRDNNTGVMGTCGGMCSCGTCHVYIGDQWAAKLPERSEDEDMMLEALGDVVELRSSSRLACQIIITEDLSGMALEIAPDA